MSLARANRYAFDLELVEHAITADIKLLSCSLMSALIVWLISSIISVTDFS